MRIVDGAGECSDGEDVAVRISSLMYRQFSHVLSERGNGVGSSPRVLQLLAAEAAGETPSGPCGAARPLLTALLLSRLPKYLHTLVVLVVSAAEKNEGFPLNHSLDSEEEQKRMVAPMAAGLCPCSGWVTTVIEEMSVVLVPSRLGNAGEESS